MNRNIVATAIIALLIGGGIGYWFSFGKSTGSTAGQLSPSKPKILFYRNPMNPAITSPTPAKDDMGMDYIPVYPEEKTGTVAPAGTVRIDPTIVQDMGVRTAAVKRVTLSRNIRTIGRVTIDEQRVARLHPKYEGWIEKLYVGETGEPVRKGSALLSVYSPQVVSTQEEYLLALDNEAQLKNSPFAEVRQSAESLLRSTKERLRLFDVPEHQIDQIKSGRRAIKGTLIDSSFNGIVMNIGAREGERITPETELYMIADLTRVWVIVDLYENDIPWVHTGDTAKMKVSGIPGRTFTGKLTYIYPYLEAKTRTVKARMEFDNPGLALKPEMFADVDIHSNRQVDAIVVPSEAIVRTGTRELVFIQRSHGQFEPRNVTVGVSSNGQTQIVSGLEPGEIVVTSSEFLIDSESKLKEATAKMIEAVKANPGETAKPEKGEPQAGIENKDNQYDGMNIGAPR